MAAELLAKHEFRLSGIRLVPSDGGRFEVSLDSKLLYSKLSTHRHAEPGEITGLVDRELGES